MREDITSILQDLPSTKPLNFLRQTSQYELTPVQEEARNTITRVRSDLFSLLQEARNSDADEGEDADADADESESISFKDGEWDVVMQFIIAETFQEILS